MSVLCCRRPPIIALTGHALKGDKEMCLDAGMDDYIPKPVSSDTLTSLIREHLGSNADDEDSIAAA